MKGGKRWNLRISGVERYILDMMMFLSRKIEIKLCQNYTKTYIYQMLYKSCSIKQIIFNNYATNLKMTISPQEPENLRFAPVIIFNFYFAFLIDIIDNIITYSLYSPHYVTKNVGQWQCSIITSPKTSANDSEVNWSRDTRDNYTTTIILTQFYINFSRQEHRIDVLYVSFKTWDSQGLAYTPFHFSSTVPLT